MSRGVGALLCATLAVGVRAAAPPPDLSGTWTLNRALSDSPKEAGFDPDWQDKEPATGGRSGGSRSGGGGGRGGRSGGGSSGSGSSSGASSSLKPRFESEEDSRKIRELVNDVENPPATLTITQTPADVTIVDPHGVSRTFHTNGKEQTLRLDAGPIGVVTRWEAAQLVIRYIVEKDRELRVTVSRAADARRLLVTAQFAERGRGEIIRRVYDSRLPTSD